MQKYLKTSLYADCYFFWAKWPWNWKALQMKSEKVETWHGIIVSPNMLGMNLALKSSILLILVQSDSMAALSFIVDISFIGCSMDQVSSLILYWPNLTMLTINKTSRLPAKKETTCICCGKKIWLQKKNPFISHISFFIRILRS